MSRDVRLVVLDILIGALLGVLLTLVVMSSTPVVDLGLWLGTILGLFGAIAVGWQTARKARTQRDVAVPFCISAFGWWGVFTFFSTRLSPAEGSFLFVVGILLGPLASAIPALIAHGFSSWVDHEPEQETETTPT